MPLNARFEPRADRFCTKRVVLYAKRAVFLEKGCFYPWFSSISGGGFDKKVVFEQNPTQASRIFHVLSDFSVIFSEKRPKIASLHSAFCGGTRFVSLLGPQNEKHC